MGRVLSLNSTLVHAREWGKIQEQPCGFTQQPQGQARGASLFHGSQRPGGLLGGACGIYGLVTASGGGVRMQHPGNRLVQR